MKIGIIGHGYVGSAVSASYTHVDVLINDPNYPQQSIGIGQLKRDCSAIFVCVPTPAYEDGQCNTAVLTSILHALEGYEGIVICKSTAPPVDYAEYEKLNLRLAHVPEFLTQARAKFDYVNPHKIVVGCRPELRQEVADILMASNINFDRVKIEYCSIAEASFFKYMANSMLAMKVVMNNEFADIATGLGLDWASITNIASTDSRLGNTHWSVPGPDGRRGFGGACFPKDTTALEAIAKKIAVETTMLSTAISTNKRYR